MIEPEELFSIKMEKELNAAGRSGVRKRMVAIDSIQDEKPVVKKPRKRDLKKKL